MIDSKLVVIAVVGSLAACAPPVVEIDVPFDEAAAREGLKSGTNTVEGQAFLRQRGGGVVTCAGAPVNLYFAGGWSRARAAALYGSERGGVLRAFQGASQANVPPAAIALMREATCDAEGNFTFSDVADGDFYVTTVVSWTVGSNLIPEGGRITKLVRVQGGQTTNVILTE